MRRIRPLLVAGTLVVAVGIGSTVALTTRQDPTATAAADAPADAVADAAVDATLAPPPAFALTAAPAPVPASVPALVPAPARANGDVLPAGANTSDARMPPVAGVIAA